MPPPVLLQLPALDLKQALNGALILTQQPGDSTVACIQQIGDHPFYPSCQVFISLWVGLPGAFHSGFGIVYPLLDLLLSEIVLGRCINQCVLPSVDLSDQLCFTFGCPTLDVGLLRDILLHFMKRF